MFPPPACLYRFCFEAEAAASARRRHCRNGRQAQVKDDWGGAPLLAQGRSEGPTARGHRVAWKAALWKSPAMPADSDPETPSELIDAKIEELGDWRGEVLSRIRGLIKQAAPEVVEEIKWRKTSNPFGVPVWSCDGMILTGETYKDKVKLTFAKGASLEDPAGLFNSSLEGKLRRAIDLREGDRIDEEAFKALVRSAAELNAS